MKALLLTGYGRIADNLKIAEVAAPEIRDEDVLIDVRAVSINPIDFKIVQGKLKVIMKLHLPSPIGFDVSGIVAATGRNVQRFKVGDEVYARTSRRRIGTFGERAALNERWVAQKPKSLSHAEAASIPLVGLTVVQALTDRAHAQKGQHVLIHAGSGGVGAFAIQYAKALGLEVTTTTSAKNAEWVRALGADHVIRYDRENYLASGRAFDIVFDTLGEPYTREAFSVVKPGGVVVSIAGPPNQELADQVNANWFMRLAIKWMSRKVRKLAEKTGAPYYRFLTESSGKQLETITEMLAAAKIRPVIDKTYAFEQIIEALIYAAAGRVKGKVVVEMR